MTRVAILHEIVSPYRTPLFSALAAEDGLDVTVVLVARGEPRRSWRVDLSSLPYPWVMAQSAAIVTGRREKSVWFVPYALPRILRRLRPEVLVVGGYGGVPELWALAWAARRKIPAVLWSESTVQRRTGVLKWLKKKAVAACTAYIVPGAMAAQHLTALGADPRRITTAPNCIDLDSFAPDRARRIDRPTTVVLCGRLSRRKNPALALEALALADPERTATLIVAGEGPEEVHLRGMAARLGLRVEFAGHLQYDELPALYRRADGMIFPTLSDIWGFVLNEATASGLPVIASTRAGAAVELVRSGINGWVVEPNLQAMAGALRELLSLSGERWLEMGQASRRLSEELSVSRAVSGFREAISLAVHHRVASMPSSRAMP